MRESSKAALGGIICALAVVAMLSTYLSPLLVYTAPPIAGLLLLIIINELGFKWSIGTYFAVSLLSVFVIADKEAAVFFTMFFGYFPILCIFLNTKINNRFLRFILKFLTFNLSCGMALSVCIFILGIGYEDIFGDGIVLTAVFIILFEVMFIIYNALVSRLQELYILKFKKSIRKLFHIR